MLTINPAATATQAHYASKGEAAAEQAFAEPQESYTGSVETLDAGAIYGDNPALSSANGDKEMTFTEVALAAFVGVAAFYCLCNDGNKNK